MLFDPLKLSKEFRETQAEIGEEAPEKRVDPHCHRETPKKTRRYTAGQIKMATIAELVGTVGPGEVLHMVGANHWNSHHLIDAMQAQIGEPCDLWVCVYSSSSPAVNLINKMVDTGRLLSVNALINHHMARSRAEVTAHLGQVCDTLSIYPVHAKVYVLKSARRGISIYSSANLTSCAWLESATITDGADFADWNIAWIKKAMILADPFTADHMSKSVRAAVLEEKEKFKK